LKNDNDLISEAYSKTLKEGRYDFTADYVNEPKSEAEKIIREIMEKELTEMEGYSYFGSNPGIPADDIEYIALEIVERFNLDKQL
jgi:hypothetical protein